VNIILSGIMGRHPYGGVAWCSLMYMTGLRSLGHDVWYLEDTGECNYDPETNALATEPGYALRTIQGVLEPSGLDERWCYIDYQGNFHGMSEQKWRAMCAGADLFINLSGGSWFWRDEYAAIEHNAFVDTDPAFTQLAIDAGPPWYRQFFERFDTLFTFGANVGTSDSDIPVGEFEWHHTWQPVDVRAWDAPTPDVTDPHLTTVMTWELQGYRGEQEFGVRDRGRPAGSSRHRTRDRDQCARARLEGPGW
jgi:hypothetical protein